MTFDDVWAADIEDSHLLPFPTNLVTSSFIGFNEPIIQLPWRTRAVTQKVRRSRGRGWSCIRNGYFSAVANDWKRLRRRERTENALPRGRPRRKPGDPAARVRAEQPYVATVDGQLGKTHLVIAPDLRGFGDTTKAENGYDKKTMAEDVHALAKSLGIEKAGISGHDIGLMVAYAYAVQYPAEVERVALLDEFIPGIGDTTNLFLLKDLWHFHFYGPTPLALVKGRERIYFEHFWNDFAADPKQSVSESDRRFYARKYAEPGAMKAGMEVFRAFDQDAKDNAEFAKTKLTMPMLVLGGEKSGGEFLIPQARMVASNVDGVIITGSGHWLIDEAPGQVIPRLVAFFQ